MDIFKESRDKVEPEICIYPDYDENELPREDYKEFRSIVSKAALEFDVTIRHIDRNFIKNELQSYAAYYGSSMPIVHEFVAIKKPVMIADYKI